MGAGNGQFTLSVIVVTYNSAACIGRCLNSVSVNGPAAAEIIVVDNNSSDGTSDAVRAAAPHAFIISNRENRGFAAACNQGICRARGDYVLLLNPDAALFPETAGALIDYLNEHPAVGIVGPRLVDERGEPQPDVSATAVFPGFRQAIGEYTLLARTSWGIRMNRSYLCLDRDRKSNFKAAMVQGACFMFRRGLTARIGLFDERFFLYFEETDFCRRCADAGMEVHYVGETACLHLGAQSMPGKKQHSRRFFESLYRYHRKHGGGFRSGFLRIAVMVSVAAEYAAHRCARWWRQPGDQEFEKYLEVLKDRFSSNLYLFFGR